VSHISANLLCIRIVASVGRDIRLEAKSTVTLEACSYDGSQWFVKLDVSDLSTNQGNLTITGETALKASSRMSNNRTPYRSAWAAGRIILLHLF
jgi:hypothetical protein